MQFTELGLQADILRAVSEQGYTTPTPIQQKAIPAVMTGCDLMASAQTGTGKTAGFTLPILHRLASAPHSHLARVTRKPRVLVLVPTRELAIQVDESVRTYGKHLPIVSLAVFGGGLYSRHPQGHCRVAETAPEPDVLGDLLAGYPGIGQRTAAQPGFCRCRGTQYSGRNGDPARD